MSHTRASRYRSPSGANLRRFIAERGPDVRRMILLVVIAGLPILFHRSLNDPFNVPKLALLTAGTMVVLVIRLAELLQGTSARGLTRLLVPAAALGLPLLVATALSPYRGWTLFGLYPRFQGLIPYLLAILLGVLVADAFAGRALQTMWAFAIGGAVVGAYAVIQFFDLDPFSWRFESEFQGASTSTLGNSNFAGGFLAMALPVAIGLWLADPRRRDRSSLLVILTAAGWMVARSRGGWAAGVAGLVVLAGIWLAPRWRWGKAAAALGAGVIAAGLVAVVIVSTTDPDSRLADDDFTVRGLWWQAALSMGFDSPFFGTGPNTYAVEGVQHRTAEDALARGDNFADDPHSVPLVLFANAGALGLLGYTVVFGWSAGRAARAQASNFAAGAFVAAVAAYFVQALVSIDELSLRMALWAALGGLAASVLPADKSAPQAGRRRSRGRPRERLQAWPAVAGLAAVAVAAVVWSAAFVLADARVKEGIVTFATGRLEEGRSNFERALGFRDDYQYRLVYGDLARQIAVQSEGELLVDETLDAYAFVEDFPQRNATREYARALTELSAFRPSLEERAAEMHERTASIDPFNPGLVLAIADSLRNLGYAPAAISILESFIGEAGDDHSEIWGALALAHLEAGDEEAARAAAARALDLDPTESRALEVREALGAGPG